MGLLEEIANPKVGNYLENLKTVEGIRDNQQRRRVAEIQAGIALENLQLQRQKMEQQRQGYQTIAKYLQPAPVQSTTATAQNPTEPTYMMQNAPAPMPEILTKVEDNLNQIPTDKLEQSNWTELGKLLAVNPAMADETKFYLNLGRSSEEFISRQTKEQRSIAETLYTNYGALMRDVAKLEDKGTTADTKKAQELYSQLITNIQSDPRLKDQPDVQQFFGNMSEYRPGRGKFVWLTTDYSKKMRDQYSAKASDWTKVTDAEGKEWLVNKLTDERKPIGESWQKAKEQAIQQRFEKGQKLSEKRIAMIEEKNRETARKFNIKGIDDIIKFKRKEEQDLNEMKSSLERALKLAETTTDYDLVDKLLQQSMSKWENTSVRAVAELDKFAPQQIGDLEQRIANSVSLFTMGEMTAETRQKIINTARQMYDKIIMPALTVSDNYWRKIASKRGFDPDQVALFKTKQEVGEALKSGIITRPQAEAILSDPRFKMVSP